MQPTTNSVLPSNYVTGSKRYVEIKKHVGMMDVTMKCQKSTVTFIFFFFRSELKTRLVFIIIVIMYLFSAVSLSNTKAIVMESFKWPHITFKIIL